MTVANYSRRWLMVVETTRRPQTTRNYRWATQGYILPRIGDVKLCDLTRAEIKSCVLKAASHLEPGSARLVLAALRAMLADALDDGLMMANPAYGVSRRMHLRDGAAKIKAMTRAELNRFLGAAEGRYAMLWYIMAHTGLRIGEAVQLRPSDVDLDAGMLRVRAETSKGRIGRVVELGCAVVARLRPHMDASCDSCPYLFRGPRGGRVHVDRARQGFKRQLARAGLPLTLTPHCLRHTYASLLVAAGAPLEWLRRQLGHGSIKITVDLYGRHAPMSGREWLEKLDGA